MELLKSSQKVDVAALPKYRLQDFNARNIAFVVGINEAGFHSLAVTESGRMSFSVHKPAALCRKLERQWEMYVLPTRRATLEAWRQTLKHTTDDVKPKLGQFRAPLRVATCGTRSFWSPNPNNELGLWFFTPSCQNIEIHRDKVTFNTHSSKRVIQWAARIKEGVPLPVSQARIDLLSEFVARKAAITQRTAVKLLGQLAFDQGIQVPGYPATQAEPQFPLKMWLLKEDVAFIVALIFGNSEEKLGIFIQALEKFLK
jgi:hypothetical protein